MKSKKAQAAMEFLMTYGWAILIVIAVVAALYATGVFKLPRGGMGRCSPCFPSGSAIAYLDHNSTHMTVRVGPAALVNLTANGWTTSTGTTVYNPGDSVTVAGSCGGDATVTVGFFTNETMMPHSLTATVHGE